LKWRAKRETFARWCKRERQIFLQIEARLSLLALALALTVPNRSFDKLARRRGLSVITMGLTTLALRLALLPILRFPAPDVE